MHTCPTTVALVSLMLPSQHHARILLIGKCFRPAAHAAFRRIQRQTLPTQLREDPKKFAPSLKASDAISRSNRSRPTTTAEKPDPTHLVIPKPAEAIPGSTANRKMIDNFLGPAILLGPEKKVV